MTWGEFKAIIDAVAAPTVMDKKEIDYIDVEGQILSEDIRITEFENGSILIEGFKSNPIIFEDSLSFKNKL